MKSNQWILKLLLWVLVSALQLSAGQTNADHDLPKKFVPPPPTALVDESSDADHKLFEDTKATANEGYALAQYALGVFYDNGKGVTQDYAEAINWYRKAAEQNFVQAEYNLGVHYANGEGVTKDETEAVKWYRKAANQSHTKAQYNLGQFYYNGKGVEKDAIEAVKWWRKAAEQGDAQSQNNLGVCYTRGDGVSKDDIEAIKWFRKAAEQGNANAQMVLGADCSNGNGVVKDYVEAGKWLNLSSAQGNEIAKQLLNDVEKLFMTRDQIAEAQRLAREFKPRKASDSDNSASPDNPSASGTGFFITDDGYLISNNHVVEGATRVRLVTSAGLISAKVVRVDAANDLALLKAVGTFSPLPLTTSRGVKLGGTVATVGFPNIGLQGFAPKLAKGEIASLSGAGDDARYFQISVPVQPGNSGGALVDERGNVVGVVSAKLNAKAALESSGSLPENVNYAVKSSFLLSFLESVPDVANKLKEPKSSQTAIPKFEDVVKEAQDAAVLVLVY
jgi:TPR repeat protein